MRIPRQEKEGICMREVWFVVVTVAAMICHLFVLQHCPTSLKSSHLCLWASERWSEYDLREVIWSLFVVCISAVCGPAFFNKQSLVTERGQAAPETFSGEVTQPTWPCDGADWPHDCKTMSGTWQRWLQVHNSVSGWGDWEENPEEFKNLLKRKKKNLLVLWLHTEPEKNPVRVRVQVTSHKRRHSEMKGFFFSFFWREVPVMKTARGCRSQWLEAGISTLLVSPLGYTEWRQPFGVTWMLMALEQPFTCRDFILDTSTHTLGTDLSDVPRSFAGNVGNPLLFLYNQRRLVRGGGLASSLDEWNCPCNVVLPWCV